MKKQEKPGPKAEPTVAHSKTTEGLKRMDSQGTAAEKRIWKGRVLAVIVAPRESALWVRPARKPALQRNAAASPPFYTSRPDCQAE